MEAADARNDNQRVTNVKIFSKLERIDEKLDEQGKRWVALLSRVGDLERAREQHGERIGELRKDVDKLETQGDKTWNLLNTLAVIGAYITAFFRGGQ